MLRKSIPFVLAILVVTAVAVVSSDATETARAQQAQAPTSVSRTFTGTDANANFQNALNDALAQADAYFGTIGADIRYRYKVTGTSGQRGGFVFYNDIYVTIVASN